MSREILKALMQLFALIAPLDSNREERSRVVMTFLNRQLSKELLTSFLQIFLDFYDTYTEQEEGVRIAMAAAKDEEERIGLQERLLGRRAVKVLKICTAINKELDNAQKIIYLFQLIEFIKSDKGDVSEQELDYLSVVADTFSVNTQEYLLIKDFVLADEVLGNDPAFLIADDLDRKRSAHHIKHIYRKNLTGKIFVIRVASVNAFFVKYMGNAEMYLNGQLMESRITYPLTIGSALRNQQIEQIFFSDIVSLFVEDLVRSRIVFEADHLHYRFQSGDIGLQDISFTEQSGHMVGIMGASGAGKSTLLNVLNGSSKPTSGQVRINGLDIHSDDPRLKGMIGFVSQDDLLIEELSVYQNLYYNAKLCFDNYTEKELITAVNRVLTNLGLIDIKHIQVGSPLNKKISGGQRKRLNIALELIREPAVLFLDEPTSGLSSRDSENIMDLLKELSFKGKLVFVVIHQPSSDIFKMFDYLLILDTGGYLIYNGNPVDAIEHFKSMVQPTGRNESECPACRNVNPEQVFNIVETSVLDDFGNLSHTRKFSPQEWRSYFEEKHKETEYEKAYAEDLPEISFKVPKRFRQFKVFIKRDILKKLSDKQYLFINFLEAPVLAFLLAFIVKYYSESVSNLFGYTLSENDNLPVYIFMSVIVAIFMGLTVSAEEIIKDRKILKREAFLNLSWSGYLLSKIAVQFLLSAIQAFTFVIIGNSIMEIKGMYLEYWIILFSSWATANVMGLLISDSFKSVVTIYILIPFLVIPQILLSGIIVKYENLNPQISSPKRIPFYGEIITARWAYEGLATYQFINNEYQQKFYYWDKVRSNMEYKSNFQINELQTKLAFIEHNMDDPGQKAKIEQYFNLLRNEIQDEYKERMIIKGYYASAPGFSFPSEKLQMLHLETATEEILNYTREYLSTLKKFYLENVKIAFNAKNELIRQFDLETLRTLERENTNHTLEEFVTNANVFERITEYEGDLIQKYHPIYFDPTKPFIKAHFYAPRKMIFGHFLPTIWVNVGVIWFMTIVLFLMLYFRVLRKTLDLLSNIKRRNFKSDNKGLEGIAAMQES